MKATNDTSNPHPANHPAAPTIDASLGVSVVGGVKATYHAVLLALVLGVGCGGGKEKATPKAEPKVDATPKVEPKVEAKKPESPKATPNKLIADPILEKAIRKSLKKPEGELTKADLEKVTNLSLSATIN